MTEKPDQPENTGSPDDPGSAQQPFQEPPTGSFGSPAPDASGGAVPPPPPASPPPAPQVSPAPGQVPQAPQVPPPPAQAPQVPPPPAAGQPPVAYGAAGYPVSAQPGTSSNAVLSLVMGILAFFVCPIILAVIAIVYGNKAKEEIEASNGMITGSGLATTGRVLGWINLILGVVGLLLLVFFVILAATS